MPLTYSAANGIADVLIQMLLERKKVESGRKKHCRQ